MTSCPPSQKMLISQNKRNLHRDAILYNFPFSTLTDWSLIHKPDTFFNVLFARLMPAAMASSKLLGELAIISVTRAIVAF